jgi:methyl-accepting chemotaxis protein
MFIWFRRARIASRLRWLAALSVCCVMALALGLIWSGYTHQLADRQSAVRQAVEVAHGMVQWAYAQQQAGKLTPQQAQQQALSTLDRLRYSPSAYFWVNDMTPRMVHHPIRPELDGQDLSDMKDPQGLPLFRAFTAAVRAQGGGFVHYQWPKPGMDRPQDKVSYVKGFAPWGWVIGSGLYIDDLQASFQAQAIQTLAVAGLVALLLGGAILACAHGLPPHAPMAATRPMAVAVYRQVPEPPAETADSLKDQADALAQVVSRLRVVGAI